MLTSLLIPKLSEENIRDVAKIDGIKMLILTSQVEKSKKYFDSLAKVKY